MLATVPVGPLRPERIQIVDGERVNDQNVMPGGLKGWGKMTTQKSCSADYNYPDFRLPFRLARCVPVISTTNSKCSRFKCGPVENVIDSLAILSETGNVQSMSLYFPW